MVKSVIIKHTKQWIADVVIGCGFCPFARKVVVENSIRYVVVEGVALHTHSGIVTEELALLASDKSIETTLIIFSTAYEHFGAYWQLVQQSEKLLKRKNYEGEFQIASFHPAYLFAGANEDDAANYTNRSPYPMLHLLREDGLAAAIAHYPNAEKIPERNIAFAEAKGVAYMRALLAKAMR
ncbi:MAG: DUF1415 domain-containing protein [Chitinophagaceae bacterium]|nr:DUF1415 domain-containing protein [Chitinophagaceae bacterium]